MTLPYKAQAFRGDEFADLLSLVHDEHVREVKSLQSKISSLTLQIDTLTCDGDVTKKHGVVWAGPAHVLSQPQSLMPEQINVVLEEHALDSCPLRFDPSEAALNLLPSQGGKHPLRESEAKVESLEKNGGAKAAGPLSGNLAGARGNSMRKAASTRSASRVTSVMASTICASFATSPETMRKDTSVRALRHKEDCDATLRELQQQLQRTSSASTRRRNTVEKKEKAPVKHTHNLRGMDKAVPQRSMSRLNALEGKGCMQRWCTRIARHPAFNGLSACAILINSALIGVVTEHLTVKQSEDVWMEICGIALSTYFLMELIIRWCHLGWYIFLTGPDCFWNIFDFVLVLLSVTELLMQFLTGGSSSMPILNSGTKTIKMLRILRIFRVFRFFQELSLLALMIMDSIKSLCWALILIAIILYVFAIIFTQQASEHVKRTGREEHADLVYYFGSVPLTCYWLVCSMLAGVDWNTVSDPLFDVGWLTAAFFFIYIFFSMLCVLNIITGVFVDNAVATAELERDFLVEKEITIRAKYVRELMHLFEELDADGTGVISWEEFSLYFANERVRSYFAAIGLQADDIERLWELLDDDKSGEIDLKEFLEGCQRLRGEARALDVQSVLHECRRIQAQLEEVHRHAKLQASRAYTLARVNSNSSIAFGPNGSTPSMGNERSSCTT